MPSPPINQGTATGAGTMTTPDGQTLPPLAGREDLLASAQGLLAQSGINRLYTGASNAGLVSGTCYFQQIYLRAGELISNAYMAIGTAAAGLTLAKLALWDTVTGALLASSADQSAAWAATTGLKQVPFLSPYAPPAGNAYYIGWLALAATMPAMALSSVSIPAATRIGLSGGIGGRPILFGSQAGLSDLPGPLTIAAGATPGTFWFGVS